MKGAFNKLFRQHIQSSDPLALPLINPRYLSSPLGKLDKCHDQMRRLTEYICVDFEVLLIGMKAARAAVQQEPLNSFIESASTPASNATTDAELTSYDNPLSHIIVSS